MGWVRRASLPEAKHDCQALGVGNEIYVPTGSNDLTLDTVDIYDAETDSWRPGPPIPTCRGYIGAALLDERIYVLGGKQIRTAEEKRESGDDTHFKTRGEFEALDLTGQSWSCLPPLPSPRAGLTATACRGRVYAIAGVHMSKGGEPFDEVWSFDPALGRWEPGPPLPMAVWGPAAATVGDVIYVAGGGDGGFRDDLLALDPAADHEWKRLAPLPTPRSDLSLAAVGGQIYAVGGKTCPSEEERWGCTGCVEIYDVDSDSWSPGPTLPMKSAWLATAVIGERLFALGGARQKRPDSTSRWTSAEFLDDVYELVAA